MEVLRLYGSGTVRTSSLSGLLPTRNILLKKSSLVERDMPESQISRCIQNF